MIDTILKHTTPVVASIGGAQIIEPSTTKNIIIATVVYLIQLTLKKLWDKFVPEKKAYK